MGYGRKECQIEEGHLTPDHVHILISIPPKYSVAGGDRISEGEKLHPVVRDEKMVRAYIKKIRFLVSESFITAYGGSPSNPQLCWGYGSGVRPA
jgi:hypothetical protein